MYIKNALNRVLCLSLFMILSLSACSGGLNMNAYKKTLEEAKIINQESDLGLEYLQFSTLTEEQASEYGDDHPEVKVSRDGYITGYFFDYPKKSDDRRLTQIEITDGEYHILGLKIGDSVDRAREILVQRGYKEIKRIAEDTNGKDFRKSDVVIKFETGEASDNITRILLTTYR